MLLLYVGPDLWMPLASAIGAVVGGLLIFWQHVVSLARRVFQSVTRQDEI